MQENLTANRKGKDTTMRKNSTIKHPALQVIGAICILCLLLSIWPPAAADAAASSGSEETYVTTVYNDRNGLPTGEANTLLQTADGYLWFGSYGGLVRYDGSTFRNYKGFCSPPPSVLSTRIHRTVSGSVPTTPVCFSWRMILSPRLQVRMIIPFYASGTS